MVADAADKGVPNVTGCSGAAGPGGRVYIEAGRYMQPCCMNKIPGLNGFLVVEKWVSCLVFLIFYLFAQQSGSLPG